jgi:DNA uptake protein ComE-like DNA-binding protein
LSLELWALSAPYAGENFQGHHLAGVEIGTLSGNCEFAPGAIDLAFAYPPAGQWQIALLLREWTSRGFVTRDFIGFAHPFIVAPEVEKPRVPALANASAATVEKAAAPVVEKAPAAVNHTPVNHTPLAPTAAVAVVAAPSVTSKAAEAPVVSKTPAPPVLAAPPVQPTVKAPAAPIVKAPAAPIAKTAAVATAPAAVTSKGVSVNTARVEELTAVTGLNKKVAEAIVKQRPYSSLDELRRVKGLTASILAKIRAGLKL